MTFTPTPERGSGKPSIEPPLEPSLLNNNYFDKFWTTYPRKIGKASARKAWAKAIKKTNDYKIIEAARVFGNAMQHQEKQFIPHPATWLNGERWEDELKVDNNNETFNVLKDMGLNYDA